MIYSWGAKTLVGSSVMTVFNFNTIFPTFKPSILNNLVNEFLIISLAMKKFATVNYCYFGMFPLTLISLFLHLFHTVRSSSVLAGASSVERFDCKSLFCHLSAL